jgi:hypothetical protein
MLYMVTFPINTPPMLAYIPYMDPMGYHMRIRLDVSTRGVPRNALVIMISLMHMAIFG